jgi:polyferredoxin
MNYLKKFFIIQIDVNKARDTGMAMVLILVILELFFGTRIFLKIALPFLVINMIVPQVFYPLAYLWFGLAHLIGTFVSKILLFLVFILLVLPVGLFRKTIGKDAMSIKKWKQNTGSVFKIRNHLYTASDIEKPY